MENIDFLTTISQNMTKKMMKRKKKMKKMMTMTMMMTTRTVLCQKASVGMMVIQGIILI